MIKNYFKDEEDIDFLKTNGWKLNESLGYWEKDVFKLFPNDYYELHYELKVIPYGIHFKDQFDEINKLLEHQFGKTYCVNNFYVDIRYNVRDPHLDSNGFPQTHSGRVDTLIFDTNFAVQYIMQKNKVEELVYSIYKEDDLTEDEIEEKLESIENKDDLLNEFGINDLMNYCESLFNKKDRSILEFIKEKAREQVGTGCWIWNGSRWE